MTAVKNVKNVKIQKEAALSLFSQVFMRICLIY